MRRIDADAVLYDLCTGLVIGARIPEADTPLADREVHRWIVRPLALPDLVGDRPDVDLDDVRDERADGCAKDGGIPHGELVGEDAGACAEVMPLAPDVHHLRDGLRGRIVADAPLRGLHLHRDDLKKMVRMGVVNDGNRTLEKPYEVELPRLR